MTKPAADTLEREKDKLYLLDSELIRRLGVPDRVLRPILPALESKHGFPKKQPLFGGRRYWPAVKSWLDKHNGLIVDAPQPARSERHGRS
jgi:hypothetical protein